MTARARFSQADLKRAIGVAEQCGLGIAGYEIAPDGTIRILTDTPGAASIRRRNSLDRLHG